jgi:hypothetical protein
MVIPQSSDGSRATPGAGPRRRRRHPSAWRPCVPTADAGGRPWPRTRRPGCAWSVHRRVRRGWRWWHRYRVAVQVGRDGLEVIHWRAFSSGLPMSQFTSSSRRPFPGLKSAFNQASNVVRDTGIEPVTSSVSGKRSPAELIAPGYFSEVETGIEPVCTALQAVASPLGHSTAGVDATAPSSG